MGLWTWSVWTADANKAPHGHVPDQMVGARWCRGLSKLLDVAHPGRRMFAPRKQDGSGGSNDDNFFFRVGRPLRNSGGWKVSHYQGDSKGVQKFGCGKFAQCCACKCVVNNLLLNLGVAP